MTYSFDFAISFASETRHTAKQLSELLSEKNARVFYDKSFQALLLGKRLDKKLLSVCGKETRFFVPLVSAEYANRIWPQFEWSAALQESSKRKEEFILPLRADNTLLPGLSESVSYLDLREMSLVTVVEVLLDKLKSPKMNKPERKQLQTWIATLDFSVSPWDKEFLPEEGTAEYDAAMDGYTSISTETLSSAAIKRMRIVEQSGKLDSLRVRIAFEWDPSEGALEFGDWSNWQVTELLPYDQELFPA